MGLGFSGGGGWHCRGPGPGPGCHRGTGRQWQPPGPAASPEGTAAAGRRRLLPIAAAETWGGLAGSGPRSVGLPETPWAEPRRGPAAAAAAGHCHASGSPPSVDAEARLLPAHLRRCRVGNAISGRRGPWAARTVKCHTALALRRVSARCPLTGVRPRPAARQWPLRSALAPPRLRAYRKCALRSALVRPRRLPGFPISTASCLARRPRVLSV